jgi:SAM-dependent methyltransferase
MRSAEDNERLSVLGRTALLDPWPGRIRREPRITEGGYLILSAIVRSLTGARDRYVTGPVEILDVGCGDKPYYPLFAPIASRYVGTDVVPGPLVDRVCPLEALDFPDESFDLVLCTQVLEHVRFPEQSLAEIGRVLRPGGHAFVSTHGTYPFHPHPTDYWRWTQQGLEALFADVDRLEQVELVPHRGSVACLAMIASTYLEIAATGLRVPIVARPFIAAVNSVGLVGDRLVSRLRYPRPMTLIANFLVVARRV